MTPIIHQTNISNSPTITHSYKTN